MIIGHFDNKGKRCGVAPHSEKIRINDKEWYVEGIQLEIQSSYYTFSNPFTKKEIIYRDYNSIVNEIKNFINESMDEMKVKMLKDLKAGYLVKSKE